MLNDQGHLFDRLCYACCCQLAKVAQACMSQQPGSRHGCKVQPANSAYPYLQMVWYSSGQHKMPQSKSRRSISALHAYLRFAPSWSAESTFECSGPAGRLSAGSFASGTSSSMGAVVDASTTGEPGSSPSSDPVRATSPST